MKNSFDNSLKISPNSLFNYFHTFRDYAGARLYALIFLILISGIFESIGIGLFLPLLNFQSSTSATDKFSEIVYDFINMIGLPVTLTSLLIILIFVFFSKGALMYIQVLASSKITADLNMRLRHEMADKYSLMNYPFFVNKTAGYLNNLITLEIDRTVSGLSKFCELISYLIYIFLYLIAATFLNFKVTIFVLVIGLVLLYSFRFLYKWSASYSIAVSKSNANMQSILIQIINNFKYLKATDSFSVLIEMLKGHITRLANLSFRLGALGGILGSLMEPFVVLFMCALIFFHVVVNSNPLTEIMILLVFFHRTFTKIFAIQITWQKFNASIGGVQTIKKAFRQLDENIENIPTETIPVSTGDIVFKDVNFRYGSKQVIFDMNLNIKKNSSVGIVGSSGAGKTTFFDLITGLIEPTSGSITIDSITYKNTNLSDLRSLIGYVTQEPVIFNDTIANNISFWESNKEDEQSMEKVYQAAKMAFCSQFIAQMSDGFDTIVGDRGVKLSGGQKQRIAIARELYKNPQIIIFDEATSSLDTESERYVQKSISELKGLRTVIIIAHRLSTIKDCDFIYVISQGKIVETGTFDELHDIENGVFRSMCVAQQV